MGISSNIRQAAHWPLTKAAGFEIFFMLHRYSVTLGSQVLVFIVGFLAGHGAEVGEYCVPGLCSPTLKVKSPTDMKNKLDRQVAVVGANLAFHVPLGAVSSCLTDTDVGVLQACSRAKTSSTVVCVTMEALPQLLAHTPGALKSAFSLGGRTVNSFTSIADLEAVWGWLEAGPGRGPRPIVALRTADEMVWDHAGMSGGCLFVHMMRTVGGCVFCFLNRPLKKMSATRHLCPLPSPPPSQPRSALADGCCRST